MGLIERYQRHLEEQKIVKDVSQEKTIKLMQETLDDLVAKNKSLARLISRYFDMKITPVQGLYIWGGVGRGKTYIMDLFYDAIPFKQKRRMHFHHFMMKVHEQLKIHQGKKDPLLEIAKAWSKEFIVLCFDEFYVSDIADAMILAKLLEYLFQKGVTLVATSNIIPDNLYENGLQRDKFLPAISLVKYYTTVINLDNGIDYRLSFLTRAEIYHYPLDELADKKLQKYFDYLTPNKGENLKTIIIQHRKIQSIVVADSIIWFDFSEICGGLRSQYDYVEIARVYHTVIISNIKSMNEENNDIAKRFIMLIDEFYDHHVTLIMSAEVHFNMLYQGQKLAFEFQRTISRLQEMCSKEYLAKPHLA